MLPPTGETALHLLADRFTGGDETKLVEAVQQQQLVDTINSGDLPGLRWLVEHEGACTVDQVVSCSIGYSWMDNSSLGSERRESVTRSCTAK